jgi:hypothetical protein
MPEWWRAGGRSAHPRIDGRSWNARPPSRGCRGRAFAIDGGIRPPAAEDCRELARHLNLGRRRADQRVAESNNVFMDRRTVRLGVNLERDFAEEPTLFHLLPLDS